MTRPSDLFDRVAAANPVPPGAVLSPDERREADALLARLLETPHDAGARRPRRRPSRRLALAGALAAGVLATALAVVLDRGPSIADRAYAAVAAPSLYHVVAGTTVDAPADLTSGDVALPRHDMVMEAWYDLRQPAYHALHYELRGGRRTLVLEGAGDPDGSVVRHSARERPRPVAEAEGGGAPDIERFDPTAQFKAAYRAGDVREDGTVTVDGRRAHRLVVDRPAQPVVDPEFVVRSSRTVALFDARTLHPIEFVDVSVIEAGGRRGRVVTRTRYSTFETLPRTPENVAKLRIAARP